MGVRPTAPGSPRDDEASTMIAGSRQMLAAEVIRRKRDGHALTADELGFLVRGVADRSLSDAQVGALAMALFLRGMEPGERVALTAAMTRSGTVLEWDIDRPVLDKHSTGGVGDKVSLMLAPIVAACGGAVPMISGRGLGHTGGTLDKLDAIPGYDTAPDLQHLRAVVTEAGCAIVGQTAELAPADRRLYAIRDATGTVESIPLIVASILSKKLAAGLDALVMDVKFGSGAFMAERAAAEELARALVEVAVGAGLPTVALLTDMDEVLGTAAGNALEVREAIGYLTGAARERRLHEATVALSASLLVQGGLAGDEPAARAAVASALSSGAAAERFAAMVRALGGPSDLLEAPDRHLAAAPVRLPALPARPGFVSAVDCRATGLAITGLGGNRRREDDVIDPAVGLTDIVPIGAEVGPDRPLAVVHAASEAAAEEAAAELRAAVAIGDEPPPPRPVVAGRIGA
jgi:thymidine phosphorylase